MTYQEVLDFLFNQFPQYQKIGGVAYKPGLDNIISLCEYLNNPQNELKIIHVAGTNGKGSTCNMLSAVYQAAGLKTGLFTSPHLIDFRERIKVNGINISEEYVINFVSKHKTFFQSLNASFFEWSTALAFQYFKDQQLDVVILETGLGGRLDATNIVEPLLSVITSISIDHTSYLGNTILEIATEKAGIIKRSVPIVLSGNNKPEVISLIESISQRMNANFTLAGQSDLNSDLKGGYQVHNKGLVLEVLKLNPINVNLKQEHIEQGLNNVKSYTHFRGRWEILQENPKVIADIGHNYNGVLEIVNQLKKEKYANLRIVWGMVDDKEVDKIAMILPKNATYFISQPNIKRALPAAKWKEIMGQDYKIEIFPNLAEAYKNALSNSKSDDLIFIGGSNFVVAEIISEFFK